MMSVDNSLAAKMTTLMLGKTNSTRLESDSAENLLQIGLKDAKQMVNSRTERGRHQYGSVATHSSGVSQPAASSSNHFFDALSVCTHEQLVGDCPVPLQNVNDAEPEAGGRETNLQSSENDEEPEVDETGCVLLTDHATSTCSHFDSQASNKPERRNNDDCANDTVASNDKKQTVGGDADIERTTDRLAIVSLADIGHKDETDADETETEKQSPPENEESEDAVSKCDWLARGLKSDDRAKSGRQTSPKKRRCSSPELPKDVIVPSQYYETQHCGIASFPQQFGQTSQLHYTVNTAGLYGTNYNTPLSCGQELIQQWPDCQYAHLAPQNEYFPYSDSAVNLLPCRPTALHSITPAGSDVASQLPLPTIPSLKTRPPSKSVLRELPQLSPEDVAHELGEPSELPSGPNTIRLQQQPNLGLVFNNDVFPISTAARVFASSSVTNSCIREDTFTHQQAQSSRITTYCNGSSVQTGFEWPTSNAHMHHPPAFVFHTPVESPPLLEQSVAISPPASTGMYRDPRQISPSVSDSSLAASSLSSYDRPPSNAANAGSSSNDRCRFEETFGFKVRYSLSGSECSPLTADGTGSREPSPDGSAVSQISPSFTDKMVSSCRSSSVDDLFNFDGLTRSASQEDLNYNDMVVASKGVTHKLYEIGEDGSQCTVAGQASQLDEPQLMHQNDDGDSALHLSLIHEELLRAEALIRRCEELGITANVVNMRNHMQQTPLCLAVINNAPEFVDKLVQLGSDVNVHICTDRGRQMASKSEQPQHVAASKGDRWLKTLQVLLRAPLIDIEAFNSDGRTALHCAVESHGRGTITSERIDASRTVRLLVENGANLNKNDGQSDKTPLHYAIEKRDVELVRLLLELAGIHASTGYARSRCASIEAAMLSAKTGTGNAALHLAVSVRHMVPADKRRLVQLLLSRGADPSARNGEGQLPREMTNDTEIVALLRGRAGQR